MAQELYQRSFANHIHVELRQKGNTVDCTKCMPLEHSLCTVNFVHSEILLWVFDRFSTDIRITNPLTSSDFCRHNGNVRQAMALVGKLSMLGQTIKGTRVRTISLGLNFGPWMVWCTRSYDNDAISTGVVGTGSSSTTQFTGTLNFISGNCLKQTLQNHEPNWPKLSCCGQPSQFVCLNHVIAGWVCSSGSSDLGCHGDDPDITPDLSADRRHHGNL